MTCTNLACCEGKLNSVVNTDLNLNNSIRLSSMFRFRFRAVNKGSDAVTLSKYLEIRNSEASALNLFTFPKDRILEANEDDENIHES